MRRRRLPLRLKRGTKKLLAFLTVIAVLALLVFSYIELKVDPFMLDFTVLKGKTMMSDLFSQTVNIKLEEMQLTYEDLITTKYAEDGAIQSVNTDVVNVNKLKNAITSDLSKQLDEYYEYKVDFPVGNATGSELLSGLGPSIEFNSIVTGSVVSEFRSEFESGGMNQTVHRLYIDITGDLIVIVGGEQEPLQLTTSVLIGETVIVGGVPTLFTGALPEN